MKQLRVLQSFTPDRGDISVNPYTNLLERSLAAVAETRRFSWPRALTWHYDVVHFHWPEHLIGNAKWLRRTVAQVLFAVLLVLLRARRVAVVKTMHNVTPHAGGSRISQSLLARLDDMVDVRVYLHETDELDERSPSVFFPHGDYREWFAGVPTSSIESGQLAHFGRIQPYKNVDGLLHAFADVDDADLRLVVTGSVADPGLEAVIREVGSHDSRVDLRLRAITDEELAETITSSEAVVLPYDYLYNSGVLLLALSLGRPVIAPETELTDAMAAEVGAEWVVRYPQPFGVDKLGAAIAEMRSSAQNRTSAPTFVGRDWHEQAARLETVYRDAVKARRA